MYNRSNKLFIKPKFFSYTTSKSDQSILNKFKISSNNNTIPVKKRDVSFYHTILINATKLQNFQKSRFFSSLSKSDGENNDNKSIEPIEGDLKNLTMIKKDLKSLIDKEMDNFEIDQEQEKFSKNFLDEMKFKITVEDKDKVILTRSVDEYLITVSFKGNRIFLDSSFSRSNEDYIDVTENEEDVEEEGDISDDNISDEEMMINAGEKNEDKVLVTIQTNKGVDSSYTLHFECHIMGQKLYIKNLMVDKIVPSVDDPLVFQDNAMSFDEMNSNVQSRMYDFLDEFGIGDRLVNFIDFYRSSKVVNNFRDVLQYFKKFLDN